MKRKELSKYSSVHFRTNKFYSYFIKGVRTKSELYMYDEKKIEKEAGKEAAELFIKGVKYKSEKNNNNKKVNNYLDVFNREIKEVEPIYLERHEYDALFLYANDCVWFGFNLYRFRKIFNTYPNGIVKIEIRDTRCTIKNTNKGILLDKSKATNDCKPSFTLTENNRKRTKTNVKYGHTLIGTEMSDMPARINIIENK